MDIEYLKSLIENQIQEDYSLEYKSGEFLGRGDGKISKLSTIVSSFANSNGGRLIIGIKEYDEEEKNHLPEKIVPVNQTKFSREWLDQILNSNIRPSIPNIKISIVNIEANEVVYILDIPQSEIAHQAKDYRYYRRYNFTKQAMTDFEIKDIMNRSKQPKLEFKPFFYITEHKQISSGYDYTGMGQKTEKEIFLCLEGKNVGKKTAKYCFGGMSFPLKYKKKPRNSFDETFNKDNIEHIIISCDNQTSDIINFKANLYSPKRFKPIIPYYITEFGSIEVKEESLNENFRIKWTMNVDEATPVEGSIDSNEIRRKYVKL